MQRGNIDCSYFPWDLAHAAKLHEVGKFASTADFGALASLPIVVNYDVWHTKWSPEVRELFMTVSKDAVERSHNVQDAVSQAALAAMVKEGGVKIIKFEDQDKISKLAPDFLALWVADMEKKGLGGPAKRMGEMWRTRRAELQ